MILKIIGIVALIWVFGHYLPLILEIGHNCLGNA
jgi:hypothetical protein